MIATHERMRMVFLIPLALVGSDAMDGPRRSISGPQKAAAPTCFCPWCAKGGSEHAEAAINVVAVFMASHQSAYVGESGPGKSTVRRGFCQEAHEQSSGAGTPDRAGEAGYYFGAQSPMTLPSTWSRKSPENALGRPGGAAAAGSPPSFVSPPEIAPVVTVPLASHCS